MKKKERRQADPLPIILIGIGALLVIGVLVWQGMQASRASSQAAAPGAAQPTQAQNIPEPNIQRVSLTDAKAAFDAQSAVFVDVRDPESYQAGHIPGSLNIPLGELENRYTELKTDQWIITYCT